MCHRCHSGHMQHGLESSRCLCENEQKVPVTGGNVTPNKDMLESSASVPQCVTIHEIRSLRSSSKKMRSLGIKRVTGHRQVRHREERQKMKAASTTQGWPEVARSHPEATDRQGADSPSRPPAGTNLDPSHRKDHKFPLLKPPAILEHMP